MADLSEYPAGVRRVSQIERSEILTDPRRHTFKKRTRIVALLMLGPFVVETEHGPVSGNAGDWLATNHPDDDPGSDIWPISDKRLRATYTELVSGEDRPEFSHLPATTLLRFAIEQLRRAPVHDKHNTRATQAAEQALLWAQAKEDR
jgi:hypothetical protein